MAKFTIELPDIHHVTSRGVSVPVNIAAMPVENIVKAALHGIDQKVPDSASGAARIAWEIVNPDTEDGWDTLLPSARKAWATDHVEEIRNVTVDLMTATAKQIETEWTSSTRGGGGGRTELERAMIQIARPVAKRDFAKEYAACETQSDRDNFVWSKIEKTTDENREIIARKAQKRLDAKRKPQADFAL